MRSESKTAKPCVAARTRPQQLIAICITGLWAASLGALLLVASPTTWVAADPYPHQPAVDVLHYAFALHLSDTSDALDGEATIQVRFRDDDARVLWLDLDSPDRRGAPGMTVAAVASDGRPLAFSHTDDRLRISLDRPSRRDATQTFTIRYRGVPADGLIIGRNRHGNRTFFGDNWPDRARYWLPTVDHPSDKATSEFVVTAPAHYQVVSNGVLVGQTALPEGLRRWHWSSSVPLPTKVMVIGVAPFAVQTVDTVGAVPVQTWVYPTDRAAGFRDFAAAVPVLTYFTDLLGPFPFEKLANVQSTTRYGGMENAGVIFYAEDAVGGYGIEGLIAHEVAHQWFGDAVTEADWHHIWLSEGFATYLEEMYLEHARGRDVLVRNMTHARDAVADFTARNPDAPLVDTTVTDPNRLLNANSYQKGAWVLHMLRHRVGDEAFRRGLRAYYARYRNGNATTDDFRRTMEEATGADLRAFFREWTTQPGLPVFEGSWWYDRDRRQVVVALEQVQRGGTFFETPLEIGIVERPGAPPRIETVTPRRGGATYTFPAATAPADVALDPNTRLLHLADFERKR